MTAELGHFALILALFMSIVQSAVPLVGAHRRHGAWIALAQPTAILQFLLVALAFGCLTHVYLISDFSVVNVVNNSHTDKPLIYKISGVWGNHEGSLLLWVLILSLFGAAVAVFGGNLPPTLKARVLAVQAMVAAGERSGRLPEVLERVADGADEDLEIAVKRVGVVLEPAAILVLGSVIGLVAIALLLPVFKMGSTVG